jgi:hypothetical protein
VRILKNITFILQRKLIVELLFWIQSLFIRSAVHLLLLFRLDALTMNQSIGKIISGTVAGMHLKTLFFED